MKTCYLSFALVCIAFISACETTPSEISTKPQATPLLTPAELQTRLDKVQAAHPEIPGFGISVALPDGTLISAATGKADPDGTPMTAQTPVRLASISKTFVAAAILRLVESNRVNLDDPIDRYLSTEVVKVLQSDGYATGAITLRHLLLHAAGLNDHFPTEAYQRDVLANPERVWSPITQLQLLVESTDPLSKPGTAYAYSDPGYILLGLTLENVTQQSLGQAVRSLLNLDNLGLASSWWEGERPGAGVPGRAHQWLGNYDTYFVHGSVDAFGGGGLIASVEETAGFFAALFAGSVFDTSETLKLMREGKGHPIGSDYRFGLFERNIAGHETFGHGGFWGTYAVAVPDLEIAVAAVALDQAGYDAIDALTADLIQLLSNQAL